MSGPENGGSSSEKEQEALSSPEGSKPNSCYTPEPSEGSEPPVTPSQAQESRYGHAKAPSGGGAVSEKDTKADSPPQLCVSPAERCSSSSSSSVRIEGLAGSVTLPLSLRANRPPLDVLQRIFPAHKPPVLELILRGCGGDLVGAIEVLLSSRTAPEGSAHADTLLMASSNGHLFEHALGSYHPVVSTSSSSSSSTSSRPLVAASDIAKEGL